MKTYRIATIPGDGIGKEVVPAGRQILEALANKNKTFAFEFEDFDWGADYYRENGVMMPEDGLDALRDKDAILFGSAGDPDVPDHITLWGLRLKICQGLDQYANVRPTRILPGIDAPLKRCAPEDLNWVIVRENSEGEFRCRRSSPPGTPDRGRDGRVDSHPCRGRAHHALRVQARAIASAQAAHGDHEEQCATPCHGDVGRNRP
jgi:isocitrate/isopropylmalate dehydrogenase